jgi:hypothetical protein
VRDSIKGESETRSGRSRAAGAREAERSVVERKSARKGFPGEIESTVNQRHAVGEAAPQALARRSAA